MTLDFQACLSISSCKIKVLGEVRCKFEKVVRDCPKRFLSLVLLCLRTLILLPLYVHQTCPPRNESRCTSHRWLSPDRFKIYWFASILNQMTMKIRAEFVPGFWRANHASHWFINSRITLAFLWNSRFTF